MNTNKLLEALKTFTFIFIISVVTACNHSYKSEPKDNTNTFSENDGIPDSVVQFLIRSASNDFRNNQPPIPIDFRNVKIGYIKSPNNENIFLLCGEFLSQDNKEWTEFTTIKTSGYEQYLGKTQYCQDATMILKDEKLTHDLKNKFTE